LALFPSVAAAQDRVFVAYGGDSLQASTKVTGEFEDLNNGTVYVRVSLHDQRRIPLDQIWYMNFDQETTFMTAEAQGALGPQHVIAIRGKGWAPGYVVSIEGGPGSSSPDQPRILTFRGMDGQESRILVSRVARIYLRDFAPPAAAPAPRQAAPQALAPGTVQVLANQRWVSTGITVRQGQTVSFQSGGRAQLSGDASDLAGPAGSEVGRRASGGAQIPNDLVGALVGRIGLGPAFGIGDQSSIVMPASGELFLGVNDDMPNDNRGYYQVVVTPR
ncbi:MAG: hypothetical protein AB7N90_13270, partial [Vicinamibacterales bacterium]